MVELPQGPQWVQIDLGQASEIYAVLCWHFYAIDRVYFDVLVQVSNDPEFKKDVVTLHNNDYDNGLGRGAGSDKEYIDIYEGRLFGATKDGKGVTGRYVRLYSNGNTTDAANLYVEVEVWGKPPAE